MTAEAVRRFLKIFWPTMPLSHSANVSQSFCYEFGIRTTNVHTFRILYSSGRAV